MNSSRPPSNTAYDEPVIVVVALTADPPTVAISLRSPSRITDPSTWTEPLPTVRTGRGPAIVCSIGDDVSVEAEEPTVTVGWTFHVDWPARFLPGAKASAVRPAWRGR